ncbi:ankyrin repeat domain-containing protein 66-like isoform X2 [Babylonia areolata]|uniref:ankyrin repeat domain-containing protein 66-like isoform X2 n=1 Tax=Babylonia areolata TaxID=304850 RepID=UPI003FD5471F
MAHKAPRVEEVRVYTDSTKHNETRSVEHVLLTAHISLTYPLKADQSDRIARQVRRHWYSVQINRLTAVHSWTGFAECSRLLLDHGAKGTARTTSGWTPAHCAAESNRISALRALHAALVPVDLKDKHGDTPRRIATIYGHRDCVRYLLQAEAEVAERRRKGLVTEEDNVYTDEDVDVI